MFEVKEKMPHYMRTYTLRVVVFTASYTLILFGGLTFARHNPDAATGSLIALALFSAFPICGVFWAIFRLLVECDDEYQRMLFAKQTLLATAMTLVIVTVWQFLQVYDVIATGPQWMAVIWLAMLGLAGPVARWKA